MTAAREEARVRSYFSNRRVMYAAFLEDLTTAKQKGLLKGQQYEQATREATRLARRCSVIVDFLDSGFFGKLRKLMTVKNEQLEPEQYRILKVRLLPQPLLLRARQARNYAAQTYSLLTSGERASA